MPADLMGILQSSWPILLMVVIFYFLLYRPQKKQQKAREQLLSSLKRGQKIVTIGGIHGVINSIDADTLMLQVSEKVEIKLSRSSVSQVVSGVNKKSE